MTASRRETLLSAAFAVWGLAIAISLASVWSQPAPPGQLPGLATRFGFDADGPFLDPVGSAAEEEDAELDLVAIDLDIVDAVELLAADLLAAAAVARAAQGSGALHASAPSLNSSQWLRPVRRMT